MAPVQGSAPVPVHAEAVPGVPQRVRWVVPAGVLGFVGEPAAVPAPLAALVEEGLLASVVVDPAAVLLDLAEGHSWAAAGARVRDALQAALADPSGWTPPPTTAGVSSADERLAAAARQVLAGEVGEYARSHGGRLEVLAAHDGVVEVTLEGTCDGCPAAGRTLDDRVLVAVRALDPSVREIVSRRVAAGPASPAAAGARRLLPLRLRG